MAKIRSRDNSVLFNNDNDFDMNYKGKGEHSVNQLEQICEEQQRLIKVLVGTLKSVRSLNLHLYNEGTAGNRVYNEVMESLRLANAANEWPLPTDYNQEQTKQYSITKEGDAIISFIRESDGCYFELDRNARVEYNNNLLVQGEIEHIYPTDNFPSGLGVKIGGKSYNAELLKHITPMY